LPIYEDLIDFLSGARLPTLQLTTTHSAWTVENL